MLKVFGSMDAKELQVKLSNGRTMTLEELVSDYERLMINEENSKKAISSEPNNEIPKDAVTSKSKDEEAVTPKLEVGKWFLIDRDIIDQNKENIKRQCYEVGDKGIKLYERFEMSNKIADEDPNQYSCLIETYIFEHNWEYKTEQEMRDMCKEVGEGMCDEVICDLELQMRICNGEIVDDLIRKADKLPRVRVIKLRDGGTGYFGGGADLNNDSPPADLFRYSFSPISKGYKSVPYAFRRVSLQN